MKKELKKILIVSYFFLPGNLAGSYRIAAWAKYFNKFGFYPIIITRNWDNKIVEFQDMSKPTSQEIKHQKNEGYEVYYLPYKGNLRDRLYYKYGEHKWVFIRKVLSFFEVVLQLFSNRLIPFKNIYTFSKEYLEKNTDIKTVVISGKPFILFKFGYLLKKKLNINWIADYRDEWCSSQLNKTLSPIKRFVIFLESFGERKWLKSASFITSVSDFYSSQISKFVNRPGYTIMNGYDEDDYVFDKEIENYEKFTITYNGTLYDSQPFDVFLESYKTIIEKYKGKTSPMLLLPGLLLNPVKALESKKLLEGYEEYYKITGRISKREVIEIQKKSHLLLMVGHKGIKGTPSSKIFEYFACRKPILLCPSDGDVLQELISKTQTGSYTNTINETVDFLSNCIDNHLAGKKTELSLNIEKIKEFSRETQTGQLSDLLNILDLDL